MRRMSKTDRRGWFHGQFRAISKRIAFGLGTATLTAVMFTGPIAFGQQAGGDNKPAQTPHAASKPQAETHLTPEQAKALFRSVDELTKFASDETGLPQKHEVKRTLTTRVAVEKYL